MARSMCARTGEVKLMQLHHRYSCFVVFPVAVVDAGVELVREGCLDGLVMDERLDVGTTDGAGLPLDTFGFAVVFCNVFASSS